MSTKITVERFYYSPRMPDGDKHPAQQIVVPEAESETESKSNEATPNSTETCSETRFKTLDT